MGRLVGVRFDAHLWIYLSEHSLLRWIRDDQIHRPFGNPINLHNYLPLLGHCSENVFPDELPTRDTEEKNDVSVVQNKGSSQHSPILNQAAQCLTGKKKINWTASSEEKSMAISSIIAIITLLVLSNQIKWTRVVQKDPHDSMHSSHNPVCS